MNEWNKEVNPNQQRIGSWNIETLTLKRISVIDVMIKRKSVMLSFKRQGGLGKMPKYRLNHDINFRT